MFGKEPHGIDAAEALVLAALIKAPNARTAALERRADALAMHRPRDLGGACAAHARCRSVRGIECFDRALAARPRDFARITLAPQVAEQLLHGGSSTVQCTLDREVQRVALDALRRQVSEVRDRNVHDGAVLVVENATGEVWAYVGGTDDLSSAPYVDGVRACASLAPP